MTWAQYAIICAANQMELRQEDGWLVAVEWRDTIVRREKVKEEDPKYARSREGRPRFSVEHG